MKQIKPGRGASKFSFVGTVFVIIFGIFWTIMAFTITRGVPMVGIIFPLFGIFFVGFGIAQAVMHYKNAHGTEEERMSCFDIVDAPGSSRADGFCPYCGKPLESDFSYCPKCGRRLPE